MQSSKATIKELQTLLKKMDMSTIQNVVVPEFSMDWKKLLHAVAITGQLLNADSLARVICRTAAFTMPRAKVEEITGRLKFIAAVCQRRTWHVVRLFPITRPATEKPPLITALNLPHRITRSLNYYMTEVEALLIENILHWRVRTLFKFGDSFLHGCTTPGEPFALFSSLADHSKVQGCVEALGYSKYVDAKLHGESILYLVRKASRTRVPDAPLPSPPMLLKSNTEEKPVPLKLTPAKLSMIREESHRDSDEIEEQAPMLPSKYEDAKLHGENIPYLVRKASRDCEPDAPLPSPPVLPKSNTEEKPDLLKLTPAKLSMIREESLRDSDEMKEQAPMLPSDSVEKPVLLKSNPEPAQISEIQEESLRDSVEMDDPAIMWPGHYDDRYIEKRSESGRLDRTLLLETTINLTIDSD